MKNLLILFLLFIVPLNAASKLPVDVSYFIADLKYSKEHGVKICEVQQGILSAFSGDAYLYGDDGVIVPQIEQLFAELSMPKWTVKSQIAFNVLSSALERSSEWVLSDNYSSILDDPEFSRAAKTVPENPNDIASYSGLLLMRLDSIPDYHLFHQQYPGIILTDAASRPYWIDKYKMTSLFKNHPLLVQIKPEWGLYPKAYTPTLADQIIQDIPGDFFVIKPRGSFVGRGVIIVEKKNLDSTLRYILKPTTSLRYDPDTSYSHWYHDRFDSFIVEKYYASDLVKVESLENKVYEPTMRIAFALTYSNETISYRTLGAYWLLPIKSVDEQGSLNETKKALCKVPFFEKVDEAIQEEVRSVFEASMPLLYEQMLAS